jgi:protein-L-isoaspartate O-methyltransferase
LKEFAPYDAIMFGGSVKKFPRIMDQMAIGGRMVTHFQQQPQLIYLACSIYKPWKQQISLLAVACGRQNS